MTKVEAAHRVILLSKAIEQAEKLVRNLESAQSGELREVSEGSFYLGSLMAADLVAPAKARLAALKEEFEAL